MSDDAQFFDLILRLWPIFVAIIGAIAWIFYELNSKMTKKDCSSCRQECIRRQNADIVRLENSIDALRNELREDIRNLTQILVDFISKTRGGTNT